MKKTLMIALIAAASLTACGKKPAPATPASTAPVEMKGSPDGADPAKKAEQPKAESKKMADPCGGGE